MYKIPSNKYLRPSNNAVAPRPENIYRSAPKIVISDTGNHFIVREERAMGNVGMCPSYRNLVG